MSNVSNVELLLNVREQARESSCVKRRTTFFLNEPNSIRFLARPKFEFHIFTGS